MEAVPRPSLLPGRRATIVVEPDMDDEDGIEYVKGLETHGKPVLGSVIEAKAQVLGRWGEPSVGSTATVACRSSLTATVAYLMVGVSLFISRSHMIGI